MVGISLLTLVPGALGGTETYARELLRALSRHGELEYRVFLPPVADGLPGERVPEYRAGRSTGGRLAAMAFAAARPGPIRRRLEAAQALHYPLTIALPPVRRPFAVTLHDVLHHDLPFARAERLFRRVAYDRSARRARLVIVPSAFTRERAIERLGLDPGRIRVVHLGLDHDRFRPNGGPREPFLLYPARPWPHKNHAALLDAFALVRRERPELELVLTGGGHEGRVYPPGVVARGLVDADELVSLYRRAAALVFPSRYEGFGSPPLEAMACGCPVACSTAGSLPEIVGGAARTFDPLSPEDIAAAILDVLARPEEWVERGLARAADFSWEAAARGHDVAYRELGG